MEDQGTFTLSDAAAALEFWKDFDLDSKRLNLEKSCVDMREMKTASINGRKKLNDATKGFRSKTREEQAASMTELLKMYQDEIDQLSRRSKFSEAAFYGLYKSILEAPDPAMIIDSLVKMVAASSTSQLEIERLKGELSQYDEEFQQLKNQDITIRRLEEQLAEYRDQIEDKVMEEVRRRMVDVEEQAGQRINEVKELQKAAEKRLLAAVEAMKQAQGAADRAQTQMFEISSQAEERVSALSAENAILAEGSERLQARLVELEGEAIALKNALTQAQNGNGSAGGAGVSGKGSSSSRRESVQEGEDSDTLRMVISDLRQDIRRKEDSFRADKVKLEGSLRDITQQLSREKEALGKVKLELAERPSKEDLLSVKRQLRMMQKVAFNVDDEDDREVELDPETTGAEREMRQLELLLTTRMKSLDSELSQVKRELKEAKRQETLAKEQVASLKLSLETSTNLIAKLEADLETHLSMNTKNKATSGRSLGTGARSDHMELSELLGVDMGPQGAQGQGQGGASHSHLGSAGGGAGGIASAAGGVVSDAVTNANSATGANANTTAAADADASKSSQQMINILQSQRDRYKDRLAQVESSMLSLQQRLNNAEAAKTQLEQDNVALFAKIRYLQSVGSGGAGHGQSSRYGSKAMSINKSVGMGMHYVSGFLGGGDEESGRNMAFSRGRRSVGFDECMEEDGSGGGGSSGTSSALDRSGEVEKRYGALYEQKMNPFAEFSQIEKQRRLQELSVADRLVLNTMMAFVSSQAGRSFLVIYLGTMHLLVFFIIYYAAHHVHHGCDPAMDALHRGSSIAAHHST